MVRDVVEEPNFTENFDLLRDAYPEVDIGAIHAEITWKLASNPRVGDMIEGFPDPTFRIYRTAPVKDRPVFSVLYRYTDKLVILLGIDRL
jgi:hypothetical protein